MCGGSGTGLPANGWPALESGLIVRLLWVLPCEGGPLPGALCINVRGEEDTSFARGAQGVVLDGVHEARVCASEGL